MCTNMDPFTAPATGAALNTSGGWTGVGLTVPTLARWRPMGRFPFHVFLRLPAYRPIASVFCGSRLVRAGDKRPGAPRRVECDLPFTTVERVDRNARTVGNAKGGR